MVSIFCKIVRGEIKSNIVYSDDNFIGILDINPKAEGHTVIIPKKSIIFAGSKCRKILSHIFKFKEETNNS